MNTEEPKIDKNAGAAAGEQFPATQEKDCLESKPAAPGGEPVSAVPETPVADTGGTGAILPDVAVAVEEQPSAAVPEADCLEGEPAGGAPCSEPVSAVPETPVADTGGTGAVLPDVAVAEEQPSAAVPEADCLEGEQDGGAPCSEPVSNVPETPPAVFVPEKTVAHKARFLPNCKITGIDYSVSLSDMLVEFLPNEIRASAIKSSNVPFELRWCPEKGVISCHPEQAGEFEIDLCVDMIRRERHIFPLKLTVNPDPKTLWKNIPSDQNGIYAKPDSDSLFLPCGNSLSIAAASQRGRSHAQEGKPRDDDFIADWDADTECAILIAADGAGSARFSRKGSHIVAQVTLKKVKAALTPDFWTALEPFLEKWSVSHHEPAKMNIQTNIYKVLVTAAWEAKQQIKQEAQNHEARYLADYKKSEKFSSRDYATTLILTVAKKRPVGSWFIATFWVGDGGQGVYCPETGRVLVQGIPDGGEFGGQTRFLTEESTEVWPQDVQKLIQRRLYFDVVDSFTAVILMTDGVSDPIFETENNLASVAKWDELWANLKVTVPFEQRDASVADALLKWMDFWSPGNHDDRTMLVLY